MTQTTLWLLPLALGSLFGIVSALKMGIGWSWGVVLQHGIVLLIAMCGLFLFPGFDWLCAYLGWAFMLTFTVVARMLLVKMTQALGLLRTEQAVKWARWLALLMWGPPGRFWLDLSFMINFYLRHDTKAAEAIYRKWHEYKLPRSVADSLTAYSMLGLLVMRDWDAAVEKCEEARARYEAELAAGKKSARFPVQIAVPSMRALLELERYGEAAELLVLCDLPGSAYGRESLETIFLSIFALLGDRQNLSIVLAHMKGKSGSLPEHARLYWQARCAMEEQKYEEAVLTFAESLRKTPAKDDAWRERTQQQMKLTQEKMLLAQARGLDSEITEADARRLSEIAAAARTTGSIMKRCFAVCDIMASRKPCHAVRVLTGIISVMFFCSYCPLLMKGNTANFVLDYGYLAGGLVLAGQWWRPVTYLFLHGGASHLVMNLFGLIWFGRFVENVFGTCRFLIIFFCSGVLSGVLQMLMSSPDDKAVGASGAILGIFGAGLAATLRLKNVLPPQIRRHELSWMIALAVTQLVFDQLVNFLFPASETVHDAVRIAAAAHFGGMISGFALGWILPLKKLGTEE
jgi:membrane associated rhomboid family serine protease